MFFSWSLVKNPTMCMSASLALHYGNNVPMSNTPKTNAAKYKKIRSAQSENQNLPTSNEQIPGFTGTTSSDCEESIFQQ